MPLYTVINVCIEKTVDKERTYLLPSFDFRPNQTVKPERSRDSELFQSRFYLGELSLTLILERKHGLLILKFLFFKKEACQLNFAVSCTVFTEEGKT